MPGWTNRYYPHFANLCTLCAITLLEDYLCNNKLESSIKFRIYDLTILMLKQISNRKSLITNKLAYYFSFILLYASLYVFSLRYIWEYEYKYGTTSIVSQATLMEKFSSVLIFIMKSPFGFLAELISDNPILYIIALIIDSLFIGWIIQNIISKQNRRKSYNLSVVNYFLVVILFLLVTFIL